MTPHRHFRALTDELTEDTDRTSTTPKGQRILHLLQDRIAALLAPPPTTEEQRKNDEIVRKVEQRVIDDSPIITIPKITDAPGIIEAQNPTAKRKLNETPCVHRRVRRNNTPGFVASPVAPAPCPYPERSSTTYCDVTCNQFTHDQQMRGMQPCFYPYRFAPIGCRAGTTAL
jgi:hypothetical protein